VAAVANAQQSSVPSSFQEASYQFPGSIGADIAAAAADALLQCQQLQQLQQQQEVKLSASSTIAGPNVVQRPRHAVAQPVVVDHFEECSDGFNSDAATDEDEDHKHMDSEEMRELQQYNLRKKQSTLAVKTSVKPPGRVIHHQLQHANATQLARKFQKQQQKGAMQQRANSISIDDSDDEEQGLSSSAAGAIAAAPRVARMEEIDEAELDRQRSGVLSLVQTLAFAYSILYCQFCSRFNCSTCFYIAAIHEELTVLQDRISESQSSLSKSPSGESSSSSASSSSSSSMDIDLFPMCMVDDVKGYLTGLSQMCLRLAQLALYARLMSPC
jgi:hypothetical protein